MQHFVISRDGANWELSVVFATSASAVDGSTWARVGGSSFAVGMLPMHPSSYDGRARSNNRKPGGREPLVPGCRTTTKKRKWLCGGRDGGGERVERRTDVTMDLKGVFLSSHSFYLV